MVKGEDAASLAVLWIDVIPRSESRVYSDHSLADRGMGDGHSAVFPDLGRGVGDHSGSRQEIPP